MGHFKTNWGIPVVSLADSYQHCLRVARSRARNFYYSFRLLSPERHQAICAIYAFMRHCDDLSDEPGATRAALEHWRADLVRALAGDLPPNPLWPAFLDAVRRYEIPEHVFHDMVDGVASDIEPRRMETFDELYRYCYCVASVVGISVIHVFGFHDRNAPALAEQCGIAFQLTNILRDVREDWERGRVYLPAEDLARFGVHRPGDGEAFRDLLRFEGARARSYFHASKPLLGMVDPKSRASLRALIRIYETLLDRIEQSGYDVWHRRIALSPWEKSWITLSSLLPFSQAK